MQFSFTLQERRAFKQTRKRQLYPVTSQNILSTFLIESGMLRARWRVLRHLEDRLG
jgi:hypothetical protein